MIVRLGNGPFGVVTATCKFFPLCGSFPFCMFLRSLLYLSLSCIVTLVIHIISVTYHNHHRRASLLSIAPLSTLPRSSLGCERAAIRASLSRIRAQSLTACEVIRDKDTEIEIMFVVRGLNAARNVLQKHRFGGLIRSQYIYANTKGLCFQTNLEALYKESQQRFKALEEKLDEAETNAGKDKETIKELLKKLAIMEERMLTTQPMESTEIEKGLGTFTHSTESEAGRSVAGTEVPIVTNLEAFHKATPQGLNLKAVEEGLKEAETNEEKAKDTLEESDNELPILEAWKLTMQPLELTEIEIRLHNPDDWKKLKAERSVNGDDVPTVTGNHPPFGAKTVMDIVWVRRHDIDDIHTFHWLLGITHNTDDSYIGISFLPLHFLYVY